MSDLRDLYQEVIFDHNRNPRNFGPLEGYTHKADGFNPLCGDKLTVYLKVGEDGAITDVSFQGAGCAISMASASLMTEALKGKPVEVAEQLFQGFHGLIMDKPVAGAELGKLMVLEGVKEFPSRVKCATLSWHTMHAALEQKGEAVTTE
ncbi:SUF system NifU family Fe-S cluster assembly protein [Ectothiorhodospiraceae bacterium 2226]|nr:SUF system NifU family Fe-S cluster assembly protein [Ectothiorhodospiraceae bacterium 2226]